jgi:hypothetical protein
LHHCEELIFAAVSLQLKGATLKMLFIFLTFADSLPAHVEKRLYTATGAYF